MWEEAILSDTKRVPLITKVETGGTGYHYLFYL